VKRDPTAPRALEKARMLANFHFIRTPEALSGGYGNLPMPRVQAAIADLVASGAYPAKLF
jgi:NitT/TauT family transport system substrate-binding protein